MKRLLPLFLLLAMAAPAQAEELSPLAKATETFAKHYAASPEVAQYAFALGLSLGFQGGLHLAGNNEIKVPTAKSIEPWLNYCYVQGHCRHVSPQAIAIASLGRTEHAIQALELAEENNTRPVK